jgi:hypothetical protein
MSWFTTLKNVVDQAYELMNNEDSLRETVSEYVYTMQTGHPRFVLDHFSVGDLIQFLDNPHLQSFFVMIRVLPDATFHYSLLYKKESLGEWWVSSMFELPSTHEVSSVSLYKYLTGREKEEALTFEIDSEELMCTTERGGGSGGKQETLLLLRPTAEHNNVNRIKKLVYMYEEKEAKLSCETTSEYIFQYLLNQPEYLNKSMFHLLEENFEKALSSDSVHTATVCEKIVALMDKNYKVYRIGILF